MDFKVYYGDATRLDLLESAGAEKAKILISAIDNVEINFQLAEIVKKRFPHIEVIVRAKNRTDAYELMDRDVKNIYRDHLTTSVRMGRDVLIKLGKRSHSIHRMAQQFLKYDEDALVDLVKFKGSKSEYISNARRHTAMQEELLAKETGINLLSDDKA